ncbi:MAG: hypothetical protein BGO20_07855 [Bosea sp. 67-29]|nr:MAG: hypothetical protein BGO20_07855 [Bosea sp. 67-29]
MQETKPLKRLIDEALERGITTSELARRIGCSRMQIWRLMRGECSEDARVGRLLRSELEPREKTLGSMRELAEALQQITGGEPARTRQALQMLQLLASLARRDS